MNKRQTLVLMITVGLWGINIHPIKALDLSKTINDPVQTITKLERAEKAVSKQNDKVEENQTEQNQPETPQKPPVNTERENQNSPNQNSSEESTILLSEKGVLENGDNKISSDNSLYDSYIIRGTEGKSVYISLESTAFDPYLAIIDSEGNILAQHDDINETNKNSAITITFPKDGEYYLIINSYDPNGRGAYDLTVESR